MTVDLGNGSWFNLRSSNTEPLLRLNVEARSTEEVAEIVGQISGLVQAQITSDTGATTNASPRTPAAHVDLDDAEGLLAADRNGLLRAASMAGAQVRATVAAFDEGALDPLRADQPPRTVIWVAGRECGRDRRDDAGRRARRFGGRAHRRRARRAAVDRRTGRTGSGG